MKKTDAKEIHLEIQEKSQEDGGIHYNTSNLVSNLTKAEDEKEERNKKSQYLAEKETDDIGRNEDNKFFPRKTDYSNKKTEIATISITLDATENAATAVNREILLTKGTSIPHSRKKLSREFSFSNYRKSATEFLKHRCTFITEVLTSVDIDYIIIRLALRFPVGVLFALGLYMSALRYLAMSTFLQNMISLLMGCFISIGYTLSHQFRCMCWLTIPTLFGRIGRAYLSTLAFAEIIDGPYMNLISNLNESVRVTGCLKSLYWNMTLEHYKFMFVPIKDISQEFQHASVNASQLVDQMYDGYIPIKEEVEDDKEINDIKKKTKAFDRDIKSPSRVEIVEKKYKAVRPKGKPSETEIQYQKKLEYRCENLYTDAVAKCHKAYKDSYKKCISTLPVLGYLICWVLSVSNKCNMIKAKGGKDGCDSANGVFKGFGKAMVTMDQVLDEMKQRDFNVDVNHKVHINAKAVDMISMGDFTTSLQHHFEVGTRISTLILTAIKRLLAFMFLLLFLKAKSYNDGYLSNIQHDNIYLTGYFKRIDARRKKLGKSSLLPLKKGEKTELFSLTGGKLSHEESNKFFISISLLIFQVITASFLIVIDYLFYDLLSILQRSAGQEFIQIGNHTIELEIEGNGFLRNVINKLIDSFQHGITLNKTASSIACLPIPRKVEDRFITNIYSIYALIFIFIFTQSYMLRTRNVICNFFYPKRQKQRTIYLYNMTLKKRKHFLRRMQYKVKLAIRKKGLMKDRSLLEILRFDYPNIFGWLKKLKVGNRVCIVCNEKEKQGYYQCTLPCVAGYCKECWRDAEYRCYACDRETIITDSEIDTDDDTRKKYDT